MLIINKVIIRKYFLYKKIQLLDIYLQLKKEMLIQEMFYIKKINCTYKYIK
jgi:hypothetical protein